MRFGLWRRGVGQHAWVSRIPSEFPVFPVRGACPPKVPMTRACNGITGIRSRGNGMSWRPRSRSAESRRSGTLRRLGARKVETQRVPVIFDPEMACSLLGHLSGAVFGYSLYKGASFLLGQLGKPIAPKHVNVEDNGRLPGKLGSPAFRRGRAADTKDHDPGTGRAFQLLCWIRIQEENWGWRPPATRPEASVIIPPCLRRICISTPATRRLTRSFDPSHRGCTSPS